MARHSQTRVPCARVLPCVAATYRDEYRDGDRDRSRRPRALWRRLRTKMLHWPSVWIRLRHDDFTLLSMYAGQYVKFSPSCLWAQTLLNNQNNVDMTPKHCTNVLKGETYCCEKFTAIVCTFPSFASSFPPRFPSRAPRRDIGGIEKSQRWERGAKNETHRPTTMTFSNYPD